MRKWNRLEKGLGRACMLTSGAYRELILGLYPLAWEVIQNMPLEILFYENLFNILISEEYRDSRWNTDFSWNTEYLSLTFFWIIEILLL